MKGSRRLFLIVICCFALCSFILEGCGPTYPKQYIDKCIIDLCKREYGVDVEVKVTGKTIGVYIPINELLDKDLTISPEAIRQIDDVIMSVSRVALSTDADFHFYVLVAQDPAVPELELVIIRYVEDVKRFLVTDISRNEYFDRMITELKLTPQIQKERMMRELFKKIGLDVSEELIDTYLKSGYLDTVADIGYWNGEFFLKDISIGEFLAKQIEERVRRALSKLRLKAQPEQTAVKGSYKKDIFEFKIITASKEKLGGGIGPDRITAIKEMLSIFSKVTYGYKFQGYSCMRLFYDESKFVFEKDEIDGFRRRKIRLEDLI